MFDIEIDGLDDLERDWKDACLTLGKGCARGVTLGVEEGAQEAKRVHRWKSRSGETEAGIHGEVETVAPLGAAGSIVSSSKTSSYLEEGTPAHEIRPMEGSGFEGPLRLGQSRRDENDIGTTRAALRFQMGGRTVFASVVHHPGTQPSPFMGPAALKAERVIVREVEIAEVDAAKIMER